MRVCVRDRSPRQREVRELLVNHLTIWLYSAAPGTPWFSFLFPWAKFTMLLPSKLPSRTALGCLLVSLLGLPSRSALADETYAEKPGTQGNGNVVIGPDYQIDPDLTDRGNPKGKYFEFSLRLSDSKIFP